MKRNMILSTLAGIAVSHAANTTFSRIDTLFEPGYGTLTGEFAKADIDKNGYIDFVGPAKSNINSTIEVYTSREAEAFYIKQVPTKVYIPRVFDFGDYDGDGYQDILVAGEKGGSSAVNMELFQGNGNPQTWKSLGAIEADVLKILRAKLVDLDQDHDLDIIVLALKNVGGPSYLIRYRNNTSSWEKTILDSAFHTYEATTMAWLGVQDLNHDKVPEIVAGCDNSTATSPIYMWLNKNGTITRQSIESNKPIRAGAFGDIDGDTHQDMVLGQTLYLGNGAGSFTTKVIPSTSSTVATWASMGDLNRDGFLDLCIASMDDGVRLWQNHPTSGLTYRLKWDAQTPKYCELTDTDNDGWTDLVYFDQYYGLLLNVVNSANIAFVADTLFTANGILNFGVGDLEGDGDQDFVVTTQLDSWTYGLSVVDNIGSGIFTERYNITLTSSYIGPPPVTGDLDGDGLMDIVMGHNRSVTWLRQVSKTSFVSTGIVNAGSLITNLNLVDLDRDGDLDVVAKAQSAERVLYKFFNNGSGVFTKDTMSLYVGKLVEFGDVNDDDKADFILRGDLASDLRTTLYYGDGLGGYSGTSNMYDDSLAPNMATFADFDDDGDQDIITGSTDLNRVGWMENTGDNNSDGKVEWLHHELMRDYSPGSVIVADLDHHGKLDLILDPIANASATWITQDSTGHLTKPHLLMNDVNFKGLIATDVDHDGWTDIVGSSNNQLVWIRNLFATAPSRPQEPPVPLLAPTKPSTKVHKGLVCNVSGAGAPLCMQKMGKGNLVFPLRDVLGRRHF